MQNSKEYNLEANVNSIWIHNSITVAMNSFQNEAMMEIVSCGCLARGLHGDLPPSVIHGGSERKSPRFTVCVGGPFFISVRKLERSVGAVGEKLSLYILYAFRWKATDVLRNLLYWLLTFYKVWRTSCMNFGTRAPKFTQDLQVCDDGILI
jgi:hypothetical protein